jgi:hypothetical protein
LEVRMATTNDITGDLIKSRPSNEAYSIGYDRIFGKKKEEQSKQTEDEEKVIENDKPVDIS